MEGFTLVSLITGIVCYALGMAVGFFINRSSREENIREAYEQGRREARAELDNEKQELGRAVTDKLAKMRDTLVDTYAAYEQAVELVEEKLHPGASKRLRLEYARESDQIDFNPTVNESAPSKPSQGATKEVAREIYEPTLQNLSPKESPSTMVQQLTTSASKDSAPASSLSAQSNSDTAPLGAASTTKESPKAREESATKASSNQPLAAQVSAQSSPKKESIYQPAAALSSSGEPTPSKSGESEKPVEH